MATLQNLTLAISFTVTGAKEAVKDIKTVRNEVQKNNDNIDKTVKKTSKLKKTIEGIKIGVNAVDIIIDNSVRRAKELEELSKQSNIPQEDIKRLEKNLKDAKELVEIDKTLKERKQRSRELIPEAFQQITGGALNDAIDKLGESTLRFSAKIKNLQISVEDFGIALLEGLIDIDKSFESSGRSIFNIFNPAVSQEELDVLAAFHGRVEEITSALSENDFARQSALEDSVKLRDLQLELLGKEEQLNAIRKLGGGTPEVIDIFKSEISELEQNITKLKTGINDTVQAAKTFDAQNKESSEGVDKLKQGVEGLNKVVDKASQNITPIDTEGLDNAREKVDNLKESVNGGAGLIVAVKGLNKEIINVDGPAVREAFSSLEDEFLDVQDTVKETASTIPESFEEGLSKAQRLFEDFGRIIGSTLEDTFVSIFEGSFKDIGKMWKDALSNMLSLFHRFVAQILTQKIFVSVGAIFGGAGATAGQGGSGDGLFGGGIPGTGFIGNLLGRLPGAGFVGSGLGTGINIGGTIIPATETVPFATAVGGFTIPLTALAGAAASILGFVSGNIIQGIGGALATGVAFIPGIGPLLSIGTLILTKIIGAIFGLGKKKFVVQIEGTISDIIEGGGLTRAKRASAFEEPLRAAVQQTLSNIFDTLTLFSDRAVENFLSTEIRLRRKTKSGDVGQKLQEFIEGGFLPNLFDQIQESFVIAFEDFGVDQPLAGQFVEGFSDTLRAIEDQFRGTAELGERLSEAFNLFLTQMNLLAITLDLMPERLKHVVVGLTNISDSLEEAALQVASFAALVQLVEPDLFDPITASIQRLKAQAEELGFEGGIPSLTEFTAKINEMIDDIAAQFTELPEEFFIVARELAEGIDEMQKSMKIDPELIQQFVDFRNALIQLRLALVDSISGLVSFINTLNTQIVAGGGAAVDTTGAVNATIDNLMELIASGTLSIEERQQVLQQLAGLANQLAAAEIQAGQAAIQSQKEVIQSRIEGLRKERQAIQESFRARIDALREELRIAEQFKRLNEQIRDTLESIVFSAGAPLTAPEQLARIQAELAKARGILGGDTSDLVRLETIDRLRDLSQEVFNLGTSAFGAGSPEALAIFEQVTKELEELLSITDIRGRTVEAIQAEIERLNVEMEASLKSIDARIAGMSAQLTSLSSQQVQISQGTLELLEFIRSEALAILAERLMQLNQISGETLTVDEQILGINEQMLITLQSMDTRMAQSGGNALAALIPAQHGFEGIVRRPTMFLTGEGFKPERVSIRPVGSEGSGDIHFSFGDIHISGEAGFPPGRGRQLAKEFEEGLMTALRGRFGKKVQKIVHQGLMN
ncbi:MAG: hypothetical protein IH874_03870 [Candidatus Dadabacteria bacterium]|nr:hypothetical protein [Candidatus Dadabacteria bacterium]